MLLPATAAAGGALQERARSWLETISGSAAHLLAIVNDIIIMQVCVCAGLDCMMQQYVWLVLVWGVSWWAHAQLLC